MRNAFQRASTAARSARGSVDTSSSVQCDLHEIAFHDEVGPPTGAAQEERVDKDARVVEWLRHQNHGDVAECHRAGIAVRPVRGRDVDGVDAADLPPRDKKLLHPRDPEMHAHRRQHEYRPAPIGASPERKSDDAGSAVSYTRSQNELKIAARTVVGVEQCEPEKAEEAQPKAGRQQPDDRRVCPVFQYL